MTQPFEPRHDVPDASAAYHRWAGLFDDLLLLALATGTDDPREREAARERVGRGLARSFAERDAMWERVLQTKDGERGDR